MPGPKPGALPLGDTPINNINKSEVKLYHSFAKKSNKIVIIFIKAKYLEYKFMYQQRMKDAIAAIKQGEMIIIMDDEDRENEGDLVMAGIFSTPEKINFMAQEARGLICVSITKELALKLDLPPMVQRNDSNHETAFTISIDAKEAKTGISAYERDMTIRLMCDSNAKPSDFVRPGHIFPLIAKDGGVLVRTGHTEASVDICRLAGVLPVSVICEIMKKDGTMAGRGDKFLLDFAREQGLKILYVSDIIQYRLNFENLVREVGREETSFMGEACEKVRFIDHLEREHSVFSFAKNGGQQGGQKSAQERMQKEEARESAQKVEGQEERQKEAQNGGTTQASKALAPLIRFHTASSDIALLQNLNEWQALQKSVGLLSQQGGYLICLNADITSEGAVKSCGDMKDFGIGAQILKRLGVKEFILLSTCGANRGEYSALSGFDLHLIEKLEV